MSRITIRGLSKRFGGKTPTTAIDALDLEIEPGEFLVLLGPSGCGKTTTLRCLAGLETADEGHIAFGDRVVFDAAQRIDVAPNKRQIGMVFQSYALWPHMSVRKNIGYPLRTRARRSSEGEPVDRGDRDARRLPWAPRPVSSATLGRPAAAHRARPRPRCQAGRRALRRAPLQPGRAAPRPREDGDPRAPPPPQVHRRVRDARPSRGTRARGSSRGDAVGGTRAARHPTTDVREARHRVRRRVHRDGQPAHARAGRRRLDARRHSRRGRGPRKLRRRRSRCARAQRTSS